MTTGAEVRERVSYLGGTDAAGVLGRSRWKTALSVWAEKTGQFVPPDMESEAKELGKELEDYVAKRFARKTGKQVVRAEHPYFHPVHAFLGANVDRLVVGEDALLECKTASAWKTKEWQGDEIPQEYVIQCLHYLAVTGLRKAYLAVLIGNQDFKIKEISRDDRVLRNLIETEVEFWEKFVVPREMPIMISKHDTDILSELFPVADEGRVLKLEDEANILVENLTALKEDAKNVEGQIETVENQLKALLGEAEAGETSLYRVAWQNVRSRRFDSKAFEAQYPDLAKQFKPEKISRRFGYKSLREGV